MEVTDNSLLPPHSIIQLFSLLDDVAKRFLPAEKTSNISVVDIHVCEYLLTATSAVFGEIFRVVIVYSVKGYALLEKPIYRL